MCGRFSNISAEGVEAILDQVALDIDAKAVEWNVDAGKLYASDVRPSMPVAAIAASRDGLVASDFTWGLQAPWDSKKLLFNTRIEKAAGDEGMWPPIARQFRCLVPATRFWERSRAGGQVAFVVGESQLVMMAGVFFEGRMSLVTTTPAPEVARFHDRMPLCLCPNQASLWLSSAWRQAAQADSAPEITVENADAPVQLSLF